MGFRPKTALDIQMWCYLHMVRAWNQPCLVFSTFNGFMLSNAHSKRGLNRLASRISFLAYILFLLWPFVIPFYAFRIQWKEWITTWLVGVNRPDLILTVGRGPYSIADIDNLASSFLHFIPGNYSYCLAEYPDFLVDDKSKFPALCASHNLPCIGNLALQELVDDIEYIVKPKDEGQGRGIVKMRGKDIEGYIKADKHIIQTIMKNHPAIEAIVGESSGLSTVRALTIQTREGYFQLFGAILRMGRSHGLVDNLSQGGIAVPLNGDGIMLKGVTYLDMKKCWQTAFHIEAHPDTGLKFTGKKLPYFEAMRDTVLRAHQTLCPNMTLCAWDIALAPSGPVLVEAASYLGGALEFVKDGDFSAYLDAMRLAISKVEALKARSNFWRTVDGIR